MISTTENDILFDDAAIIDAALGEDASQLTVTIDSNCNN
jgi:hypothetical protein